MADFRQSNRGQTSNTRPLTQRATYGSYQDPR